MEYQVADEEIRRREAAEAAKRAQEKEACEERRHQELVAVHERAGHKSDEPWYKKPTGLIIIGIVIATAGYVVRGALMRWFPQWFK